MFKRAVNRGAVAVVSAVMMVGGLLVAIVATAPPASAATNWQYQTDMMAIAPPGGTSNGGTPSNSWYSSNSTEVAEECTTTTNACGMGEPGAQEPFGATILNNLDSANSGVTFGCPSSKTSKTAAAGTTTGTASGSPPAVIFMPGVFAGGQDIGTNIVSNNQCYSPYVACTATTVQAPNINCSAALSSNSTSGEVYPAAPADDPTNGCSGCVGRELAATVYIAPHAPDGVLAHDSGSACSGHILVAGGATNVSGTATPSKTSELYDPRVTVAGAANSSFNTWSTVSNSMTNTHDTPGVQVLQDGRVLLVGGESTRSGDGTDTWDLFDPTTCKWEAGGTTTVAHYDFGIAMFASGTGKGDVLACGGNSKTGAAQADCELFTPGSYGSGGTWQHLVCSGPNCPTSGPGPMLKARSGGWARALPNGNIVEGGGAGVSQAAEECTVAGCSSTTIAASTWNGTYAPIDSSVDLLGAPLDGATSSNGGTTGGTTTHAGLLLVCGAFGIAQGRATQKHCEYYVPSGTTPTGITGCTTAGPYFCNPGNIDMNRERVYFFMQEVPQNGTTTSDRVLAMAGYYGADASGYYLVRKNVEYLAV